MFRTSSGRSSSKFSASASVQPLAATKDLANLVNAQTSVVQSIRRLVTDIAKSSEALKQWGDIVSSDFSDVLTASTMLLLMFSDALSIYGDHETSIRDHLNSILAREEDHYVWKVRHRATGSRTRQHEGRAVDPNVAKQEAELLAFKRRTTKTLLGLKFGGLQELSNKGLIVAHNGKLVVPELLSSTTSSEVAYTGSLRTQWVVRDAQNLTRSVQCSSGVLPVVAVTTQLPAPLPVPSQSPSQEASQLHPALPYEGPNPIPIIDESGTPNIMTATSLQRGFEATSTVPSSSTTISGSLYPSYVPSTVSQTVPVRVVSPRNDALSPNVAQAVVPMQGSVSVSYSKTRIPSSDSHHAEPFVGAPKDEQTRGQPSVSQGRSTPPLVVHSNSSVLVTNASVLPSAKDPDAVLQTYQGTFGARDTTSPVLSSGKGQGSPEGKAIKGTFHEDWRDPTGTQ